LIRSVQGLHRRAVEAAKEAVPENFTHYPHADALKLGWYPSMAYFREDAQEVFWKALPDTTGVVFPYYFDFDNKNMSHLVVAGYRDDGSLDPRRRTVLPAKGQRPSRVSGIFGIGRLKEDLPAIVVTDDELLVCRYPGVVAVSAYSPKIGQVLRKAAPVVNLRSSNPRWLEGMFSLSKHGIQLTVADKPLVEHIRDTIVAMYHDKLGLAVVTGRVTELLAHLVPLERLAVIQMVKAATNVDFEHVLPDDFHIYRREADFYKAVRHVIDQTITQVEVSPTGMLLQVQGGMKHGCLLHPLDIQAALCTIFKVENDLVEWIYRDVKEIPRFYLYRGNDMQTRAEVSARLVEVVTTILMRKARP
jgi:hypothetical protein